MKLLYLLIYKLLQMLHRERVAESAYRSVAE